MSEALNQCGPVFLALVAGLVLGLAHFASLRVVTSLLLTGGHRARALALQGLRMAVSVAVFVGLALAGAMPLLAGALGFLLGRAVVLGRTRRET